MKKSLKRLLALTVVLCVAVALMAGCGGSSDEPTDPTTTKAPTQTTLSA